MFQTLKPKPPPLPPSLPQTDPPLINSTTATPTAAPNNTGPISKPINLPTRRKRTMNNKSSKKETPKRSTSTTSPPSNPQGPAKKPATIRTREEKERGEEEGSITTMTTIPKLPQQESVAIMLAITPAEQSSAVVDEMETNAQVEIDNNEAMVQQLLEHREGAHVGRDPYGLASKPYLDVGMPPPWERCDLCEEAMVWLRRRE